MGMRIQGGSYSAAEQMQWQQRRQNFYALSQAISSGNLSSAKDAFAKITSQTSGGGAINPDSFLGKLGAALQSGDMTAAQQLLATRHKNNGSQPAGTAQAAVSADVATGTDAATAATGRHHHHHNGGSSPALDLSQAIQSGDLGKAQSAMQTIVSDLQQLSTMAAPAGSGSGASGYGSLAASAASAAQKILPNPDFQALEDAVSKGDAAGMKSAWAKLIGGAGTPGSAAAATASAATAQTQIAA